MDERRKGSSYGPRSATDSLYAFGQVHCLSGSQFPHVYKLGEMTPGIYVYVYRQFWFQRPQQHVRLWRCWVGRLMAALLEA